MYRVAVSEDAISEPFMVASFNGVPEGEKSSTWDKMYKSLKVFFPKAFYRFQEKVGESWVTVDFAGEIDLNCVWR